MSCSQKFFFLVSFLTVGLIIGFSSLAQTCGMMHTPVGKGVGEAGGGATTTASIFIRGGSPDVTYVDTDAVANDANKFQAKIYYKNGTNPYNSSACIHRGIGFHQCTISFSAGADNRQVAYYVGVIASTSPDVSSYMPSGTQAVASSSPFYLTVQNSNLGAASITGKVVFSQSITIASAVSASTTVPLLSNPLTYTQYAAGQIDVGDWIYFDTTSSVRQIAATSTNAIVVNSDISLAAGTQIYKLLSDVWVFAEGTSHFATTSGTGAATGGFTLSNMAAGSYRPIAFKAGMCDAMPPAVYTGTNNIIYLTAGCGGGEGGGGTMESFSVIWTAPADNMMSAPRDISFDKNNMANSRSPILIGLSQNASSTTITTSTVLLKKIVSGQLETVTTTAVHYYDPIDATTFCLQGGMAGSCMGPERKIILYSPTVLSTDSQYVVEITGGVLSSNGNPLQGNRQAGGHTFMFTTSPDTSGMQQNQYGQGGAYMPPFVTGMMPSSGSFGVPLDSNILVMFSQAMDSTTITGNVQLCKVTNQFTSSETENCTLDVTLSFDNTTKKNLTIDPSSSFISSSHYRVKILGGLRSSAGLTIGPPDNLTTVVFRGDFDAGSSSDSGSPTFLGTNLARYSSGGSYINIPVSVSIEINFNEGINPSTISKSSMTVKVKGGTTNSDGTVEYDPFANRARFVPAEVFNANTVYTLTIATSVQDLAGNYFDGDTGTAGLQEYTLDFTTAAGGDTTGPQVMKTNADDYVLDIAFNEPMIAVSLSDPKWASSTINVANYTVKYGSAGTSFGANCASAGTAADLTSARLRYEASRMAAVIENIKASGGAALTIGNDICVYAQNVIDLSNNVVDASYDTIITPIQDHKLTYGMFEGSGMMMGPPSSAGGMMGPMVGTQNPGAMGMMSVAAYPMNPMANISTLYFIDMPTTKALEDGSLIVFDFKKQGFDVTSAVPDPYSPMRNDWNGPGACRIRLDTTYDLDGVTVDATLETVTLKLDIDDGSGGACTPSANEFYHFDVAAIKNAAANSTGYTVSITTKKANGTILETNTTMPFTITAAGSRTISIGVTVNASTTNANIDVATSTLKIMLGSPMTGPMEGTITYDGTGRTATTTFSSLNDGDYFVFTNPSVSLPACDDLACTSSTSKSFIGITTPDPIRVSGGNVHRGFTINPEDSASSTPVEVYLKGNFGSQDVDIFGSSPTGFVKKKLTSVGNLAVFTKYNFYLPSNGNWRVGIGPAASEGAMSMGPPPMPDWMPPSDVMITASTTGSTNECIENSGATANDCKIYFEIKSATSKIIGYVKDSSGAAITDAGVDAYKNTGFGMTSHIQTDTTGKFELKVALGDSNVPENYGISVYKPGLPPIANKNVVVTLNDKNPSGVADVLTDSNTTANVYLDGSIPVTDTNPLILYVVKGGYTISGRVYEDTASDAKTVAYAPVWANNTQTGEFIPSGTDASGFFVLYVKAGTWKVSGHTPELGDLPPVTVTVSNADQSINLRPSVGKSSLYTISGNTGTGADKLTGVQIWLEGQTTSGSQRYENGTISDSDGNYSLRAPAGCYRIHARHPDYGEYSVFYRDGTNGSVCLSGNLTVNFTPPTAGEYTSLVFKFTNAPASSTRAFVDVFDPTNKMHNGVEIQTIADSTSSESVKVVTAGGRSFYIKTHIPGFGELEAVNTPGYDASTQKITIANGTTEKLITFTLPTAGNQVVISGNVTSSAGAVGGAMVWIGSMSSGFHFNTMTDSAGDYSLRVPAGTYRMGVDKPGYSGIAPTDTTFNTSTTQNFVLTANDKYITGTITSNGTTAISGAWVWAEKVTSATDMTPAGGWAGGQTDSLGIYSLSVGSGYWVVRAVAEGYQETRYASIVSAASNPTVNITLVAQSGYAAKEPKQQSIIPSQGGVFDDSTGDTKVKLTIPQNFDDDSNQGKVMVRETSSVPKTTSKMPVGGKGKEINIYNSNNVPIKGSSATSSTAASGNTISLEIYYTESDVTSAGYTEDQLTLGYWDESSNQWQTVDAVVDTANNVIRASTSHFSVYAPLLPVGANPPSQPGTPAGTLVGSTVSVQWTSSTDDVSVAGYEVYRSTSSGGTFANVSGDSYSTGVFDSSKLVGSCSAGVCTWTDSSVSSGNTYYYKVAAFDNSGNYSTSTAASAGVSLAGGGGAVISGGGVTGDNTAPDISNIKVQAADTQATITWQTSESSITWLVFGTTTAYGLQSKGTAYTVVHSATLSGLTPGTTYHYQVKSMDSYSNVGSYADKTFTTSGIAPTTTAATATTTVITAPVTTQEIAIPTVTFEKPINQMTTAELQAKIIEITKVIAQLQALLAQVQASGVAIEGIPANFKFAKTLKFKMTDKEVKYLQIVLNADKDTLIAEAGVGSKGKETNYFGDLTKKAVIKFQEKYKAEVLTPSGLTEGTGLVGIATRTKLNMIIGR